MFEDEMTEENLARTAEDYYKVTQMERHNEQIAVMRAYISALESKVFGLTYQRHRDTLAMLAERTVRW